MSRTDPQSKRVRREAREVKRSEFQVENSRQGRPVYSNIDWDSLRLENSYEQPRDGLLSNLPHDA